MTALAIHGEPDRAELTGRAWIELMAPAVELAKAVAGTEFVPKNLRHNPAGIAAAILYGDEVGLGPMQALAKIAVIDGRPALAAEAQRALILAAGHELWIEEYTTTTVTVAGRRAGSEVSNRVTWTMDDARRAGLAGRPSWRAYPRQMLLARASAELARATFADVIGGLAALEELEAPDGPASSDDATSLEVRQPRAGASRKRRRTLPAAAVSQAPPAVPAPALPGEEGQPQMSSAQRRKMMAAYRDAGLSGPEHRAERLEHAAKLLGRPLTSSSDLSADEASQVIEALQAELEAPFLPADPDSGREASEPAPPTTAPAAGEQPLPLPEPSPEGDT